MAHAHETDCCRKLGTTCVMIGVLRNMGGTKALSPRRRQATQGRKHGSIAQCVPFFMFDPPRNDPFQGTIPTCALEFAKKNSLLATVIEGKLPVSYAPVKNASPTKTTAEKKCGASSSLFEFECGA